MADRPPPRKKSRFFPSNELEHVADTENPQSILTPDQHYANGREPRLPTAVNLQASNSDIDDQNGMRSTVQCNQGLNSIGTGLMNNDSTSRLANNNQRQTRRQGIYGLGSLLSPTSPRTPIPKSRENLPQSNNPARVMTSLQDRSSNTSETESTETQPQRDGENEAEENPTKEQAWIDVVRKNQTPRQTLSSSNRQTIDLDRDTVGKLLPRSSVRTIVNLPSRGISNLPLHATTNPVRRRLIDSLGPPQPPSSSQQVQASYSRDTYTAQNDVSKVKVKSKRKRPDPNLPVPLFAYKRTGDQDFNIFSALLSYPELCFTFSAHLPIRDLISLYAISKDYHTIIDTRFTTVILSQALRKAPEAARAFPFRSYAHLCRKDPAARIPHPDPARAAEGVTRHIPGFRWLKMVIHREKVVQEIMALFAEGGVPLPARCALAIKRMWFLLDIPDNARRIGYVHSKTLFTDMDLYFATCFFVKLDMLCNDPVGYIKADGLRKMLLSQPTFTVLVRVLKRELWVKKIDLLRAWVCYRYDPVPQEMASTFFGIPARFAGRLKYEYWGRLTSAVLKREPMLLLRPEQLVMREAIRRGLSFSNHFLKCLMYGYVRPDTLQSYQPRTYGRRVAEWADDEYGVDDLIGGVNALAVEDGGDGLLDLGEVRKGSPLTIVPEKTSREEIAIRKRQDDLLQTCMRESEAERSGLDVGK